MLRRRSRPLILAACALLGLLPSRSIGDGTASSAGADVSSGYVEGGPFHWAACFDSDDPVQVRYRCGWLDVPLDYTNLSDTRTVRLATVLLQVGPGKSARTVLYNPGGPGESATGEIYDCADLLLQYTARSADILAFDPRGVNMTTPQMSCYDDDAFRVAEYFPTMGTRDVQDADAQLRLADAANRQLMQDCRVRLGDLPRFMSTVAVAKDMDLVREALGEAETNAIFISYATSLFITYAQLFPSRVGRVVLQAVVDQPHQARMDTFGLDEIASVPEVVYDGFFRNCVRVGPIRCPFARTVEGEPRQHRVAAMNATFWRMIDDLGAKPLLASSPVYGVVPVTPAVALGVVADNIYHVSDFILLGQILADLDRGETASTMREYIDPLFSVYVDGNKGVRAWPGVSAPKQVGIDAGLMTVCADAASNLRRDFTWWSDLSVQMYSVSRIGAGVTFNGIFPCRHFDWTVTEELTGPLNASLSNPVLLVASTHDPATPLFSAERMARAMGTGNMRLVEVQGFGHGAQLPSACLVRIAQAVFVNGTLPSDRHTVCQPDHLPFGEDTKALYKAN